MLYPGSRVTLQGLTAGVEYNGARGDVLHYDAAKDRYGVRLIHPDFKGKALLLRATNLTFLHASLPVHLQESREELAKRNVELQETTELGRALVAGRQYAAGDILLFERPFMVVANPAGHEKWMLRWDCAYDQAKAGRTAVAEAFRSLTPGPDGMVAHLLPDARSTVEVLWSCAPGGAERINTMRDALEAEAVRVATDFARWQTNQHTLPDGRSALYLLAPLVAHSCGPNVEWDDPDSEGRVALRALQPLQAGELLGVNYQAAEFLRLAVGPRRQQLLKDRFFHCLCSRCVTEDRSASGT